MKLELETEQLGAATYVVSTGGDIDLYTSPDLEHELARLIDQGAREIVVELARTSFVDSTALGILVRAARELRKRDDGRLALVVTDDALRRTFEITGLDRVFSIHGSRAEAVGGAGTA